MRPFTQYLVCLAALLIAVLFGIPAAHSQTITNIASANWTHQGNGFSINSNEVSIDVIQRPVTIETFVADPPTNQQLPYTPATCGGVPITVPGATGPGSSPVGVNPASALNLGQTLMFRVVAPAANTDPGTVNTLTAVITTVSGDRETVTVFETAPDSGLFVGAIRTRSVPLIPVQGDCLLSAHQGELVTIEASFNGTNTPVATARVNVLADPYGLVFDSETGTPVSGARVTLVDALTGVPARVFAEDGLTPWPSTMISGEPVTDGAGNVYAMLPGEYRFPLVPLGTYRLVIETPSPFTTPSVATLPQLALLQRPDGGPFEIVPASFGSSLTLTSPAPVRVDIPLDHPPVSVTLTKTLSRPTALPGDVVFYTLTVRNPDPARPKQGVTLVDTASPLLRLRLDTVRINGAAVPGAVQHSPDGRVLTIALGDLGPGATRTVTYAMTVRADARAGQAPNTAVVTDSRGISSRSSAFLRIERNDIAARMTLIGRITDGGCSVDDQHNGIPGVRVVLEDGSFAITDIDGRYHFEGLVPGSHVVQALGHTLPKGGQFVDCARSTRSAGSASSRFVIGQGGSLVVADFSAILPEGVSLKQAVNEEAANEDAAKAERRASGADTDWLASGKGPTEFLFPAVDHNPRAPAVRVVIRHKVTEKIELKVNGKAVDPVLFDGMRQAPGGTFAVSIWRGLPLEGETTRLSAIVRDEKGKELAVLDRTVHFSATPARVEVVPELSRLIADGSTRPVLALRVLDRDGRPVHAGLTGEFSLSAPYESGDALDRMQSRALSGLGRSAPRWLVKGDDGIAYVELAPTMVSGKLHMEFNFNDRNQRRRQQLDAWVVPGDQKWTLVGLAEGSVGAKSVADQMQRSGQFDSDLGNDARVALYAKGRVLGKFLLTATYDSAKQRDDQRLMGTIDPRAYYTVFADGSDRRFDAASREKLYVRVESSTFYALYGDFESGFDQTQLARYQRAATGFKGEFNDGGLHVQGFAAKIASNHRRDEIQGGGISGPYRLSSREIIGGSETVVLEVRDRFRSEVIVSSRTLVHFIDYDLDLLSGTITFKEPVLSRDANLNPQFIVIDYELDEAARGGRVNAGLRADYTAANGRLRVGASAITDTSANGGQGRNHLAALDVKAQLGANTEVRAESAMSFNKGESATAWLVEVEHHTGKLDVLAYGRSADAEFGLGQQNGAERGRRKFGLDARVRITPDLSVATSTWHDDSLTDGSRRFALQTSLTWETRQAEARLAFAHFADRLADGRHASSDVVEASVTRRFLNNRLELSAATSLALSQADSVDQPERHRLTARYSVTSDVKLVGTYEIAQSEQLDARTGRIGIELAPWNGARLQGGIGQQTISEFGKRSFANFGLAQNLPVTKNLTLDATLDSSKTIGGFDAARLVNPQHPASSGGSLGEAGLVAEDFTAVTLGASWRTGRWSSTIRGEWRDGELANRKGVTLGAIRQLGEGSMVGTGLSWTQAHGEGGTFTRVIDGAIAAAHRPSNSDFAFLAKLQYRSDKVLNAQAGEAGGAGRTLFTVDGDARSDRLIASLSTNWTPKGRDDGAFVQRNEVGLFVAARHNLDRFQGFDLAGTTLLGGLDLRIGIGDRVELGGAATVRTSLQDNNTSYAIGPQIGVVPAKDVMLLVGYNFAGFKDSDFSSQRNSEKGVFATLRMKFDADTFGFLGLGR